jgi:hypothetical protein
VLLKNWLLARLGLKKKGKKIGQMKEFDVLKKFENSLFWM